MGKAPEPVGIAGGTCSNFFREKGLDAYAWQTGEGTLHAPNEYLLIDNLVNDTKVFATLFYKLCLQ
jgi:succinyl-diaminopimelate desuccinylase